MKRLPVFVVVSAPCTALAAEAVGTPGFSMVGSFFQMLASLAIVIGVILLAYHVANRFMKGGLVKKSVPRYIRVVESRFLAPKKSLMLVEVGGEYLLLGTTESGVNLIKQIDMLETIEVVEELTATSKPAKVFPDVVRSIAETLQKKFGCYGLAGKRTVF